MNTDTTNAGAPAAAPATKLAPLTSTISTLAFEQAKVLAEEITAIAVYMDRLHFHGFEQVRQAVKRGDPEPIDLLLTTLRNDALRVGWLGDLLLEKLTGMTQIRGDAEHWLLCPIYPQREENLSHG